MTIAVAVEQGKAQLQTVTYDARGKSTVVPLSEWRDITSLKPSLGTVMFHVRAANAYAAEGVQESADAARSHAMKAFE